jgi:hypothetical protein
MSCHVMLCYVTSTPIGRINSTLTSFEGMVLGRRRRVAGASAPIRRSVEEASSLAVTVTDKLGTTVSRKRGSEEVTLKSMIAVERGAKART